MRLQRGRAFWGAEMHPDILRSVQFVGLQRGRAFWGAEISSLSPVPFPVMSSFNGAAPFGARRYVVALAEELVRDWLQRGRAFWGAEIGDMDRAACIGHAVLQRGRAFWGAEINCPKENHPAEWPLQRGRAFWGAEIWIGHINRTKGRPASTGPRLLGRGDTVPGSKLSAGL